MVKVLSKRVEVKSKAGPKARTRKLLGAPKLKKRASLRLKLKGTLPPAVDNFAKKRASLRLKLKGTVPPPATDNFAKKVKRASFRLKKGTLPPPPIDDYAKRTVELTSNVKMGDPGSQILFMSGLGLEPRYHSSIAAVCKSQKQNTSVDSSGTSPQPRPPLPPPSILYPDGAPFASNIIEYIMFNHLDQFIQSLRTAKTENIQLLYEMTTNDLRRRGSEVPRTSGCQSPDLLNGS